MTKRLLQDKLISKENIKEKIKLIKNSDGYYISENGNVYINYGNNQFHLVNPILIEGEIYYSIKYNNQMITKKCSKLVAQAFIENKYPDILTIVAHKNNITTDNTVDNLCWITVQDAIQMRYSNKLSTKPKNTQAKSIYSLTLDGQIIKKYHSMIECIEDLSLEPFYN